MPSNIKHSDALYYPYINIRNLEWLKATLLVFPHVLRMVPRNDYIRPSLNPLIDELYNTRGSRGQPLVGVYDLESLAIDAAADRFRTSVWDELQKDRGRLQARFSRESAKDFGRGDDSTYQIHDGKVTGELGTLLESEGLMWRPDAAYGCRYDWWAMHPLLGDALMSCFAVAAARDAGCEIVTDDLSLHRAVSQPREDETFSDIKDRYQRKYWPSADTIIAQLVIMNTFDITSLSLRNLIAMAKEEDALYEFRTAIAGIAETIPEMEDAKRQEAYVKEAAEQIMEKWLQSRSSMSGFTKRFFGFNAIATTERSMTDLAKAMVTPALAGLAATSEHSNFRILAAAAGLAVGVVYYAASEFHAYKAEVKASPLRYLSLVSESGSNVSLSKTLTVKRRLRG